MSSDKPACLKILSFVIIAILAASCGGKEPPPPTNNNAYVPPAQSSREVNVSPGIDKSPMDMCYYPSDYPIRKMSGNIREPLVARLIYSRPRKDGRTIFGEVVKFGAPWRLGANEATEIEFFRDVTIQNKRVEKGRYVLYCIPEADQWTIAFNSDLFSWGLKINPALDVHRFTAPVGRAPFAVEIFTMDFEKSSSGFALVIAWDDVRVALPIVL